MTTDLFLAAAGVEARALEGAVPPACLRGVDPAPIAARDGADTLLMLPTWTPRRPAAHLLPSFAPLTDAPLAFRFEVSALADGEWSAWAASATIGAAEFAPLPSATPPLTCDVDVFRAAPAVDAVKDLISFKSLPSAEGIPFVFVCSEEKTCSELPEHVKAIRLTDGNVDAVLHAVKEALRARRAA